MYLNFMKKGKVLFLQRHSNLNLSVEGEPF
jgi:hypothetical protein